MKRTVIVLGLAAGLILQMAACSAPPAGSAETPGNKPDTASESSGAAYHKITAEEAKRMIDAGGVIIVDVRTKEEYEEKHIPGAILVPLETIGDNQPEALPDKEAVLLIHCRTGRRSKQASDKLSAMGYQNLYDFGGIVDWPYETESGEAG